MSLIFYYFLIILFSSSTLCNSRVLSSKLNSVLETNIAEGIVINKSLSDEVYHQVGNYEKHFGGAISAPVGSTIKLLVEITINGEMAIEFNKDSNLLTFEFSNCPVENKLFPLEYGPNRNHYPKLFASYDLANQISYITIVGGDGGYNGLYTIRVINPTTNELIDAAHTVVNFAESPVIVSGQEQVIISNYFSPTLTTVGNEVIVNVPQWSSITLDASVISCMPITCTWTFKPIDSEESIHITDGGNYDITMSPEGSVLTIRYGTVTEHGVYTVTATNEFGSHSVSTQIQQVGLPKLEIGTEITKVLNESISVVIGQYVEFPIDRNPNLCIEIRAKHIGGYPNSVITWYYSVSENGRRTTLSNSSEIIIEQGQNGGSSSLKKKQARITF